MDLIIQYQIRFANLISIKALKTKIKHLSRSPMLHRFKSVEVQFLKGLPLKTSLQRKTLEYQSNQVLLMHPLPRGGLPKKGKAHSA